MQSNTVTDNEQYNNIIISTEETTVEVTQPVTSVVEIITLGPRGPQGPQGIPGISEGSIFQTIGVDSFRTTASLEVTSSFSVSGSSLFIGDQTLNGSLYVTGSINLFGGSILGTASFSDTASYLNPLNQVLFITGGLEINQTGISALNITSASVNIFSVSNGITRFGQLNYTPSATAGGMYFDGTDFFFGF